MIANVLSESRSVTISRLRGNRIDLPQARLGTVSALPTNRTELESHRRVRRFHTSFRLFGYKFRIRERSTASLSMTRGILESGAGPCNSMLRIVVEVNSHFIRQSSLDLSRHIVSKHLVATVFDGTQRLSNNVKRHDLRKRKILVPCGSSLGTVRLSGRQKGSKLKKIATPI